MSTPTARVYVDDLRAGAALTVGEDLHLEVARVDDRFVPQPDERRRDLT